MRFGKAQERKFGTLEGAYSLVTERENYDSQITLTDFETKLIVSYFGKENIQTGNVQSNPDFASKPLKLYPDGQRINLNIVFPKPEKTELRLYISSRAGFKPEGGEIWFLFVKDTELWIGSLSESEWRLEFSELKRDDCDSLYQETLNETDNIRISRLKERDIFARDRNVALKRMDLANYLCEFDASHHLFISRFSKKPYLEAHHLIPIGLQDVFNTSLDTINNICCLCPSCHRAVHYADESTARNILKELEHKRKDLLNTLDLTLYDLYSLYALEEIVK